MTGGKAAAFAPIKGGDKASAVKPRAEWKAVVPVPDDAPGPMPAHYKLGLPEAHYEYRDENGRLLLIVFRFDEGDGGKSFVPQTWCRNTVTGVMEWRWKSLERPRPLYGLDRLPSAPDAAVVVCEGEKAADAAELLLPDHVSVTSPGGSNAAKAADWSPLKDRTVFVWPDNDTPGRKYATAVTKQLRHAGAVSIVIVEPPADAFEGWDAADAMAEKWDQVRALSLIETARPADEIMRAWHSSASGTGSDGGGDENDGVEGGSSEGGGRRRGPPQRDTVIALVDAHGVELWHDGERETYATYPVNGHSENSKIRSRDFKRWLAGAYYVEHGGAVGGQALEDALRVFDARAANDGACYQVCRRIGRTGDRIYLDLCDDRWRVVEVGPYGWAVLDLPPAAIRFLRSQGMEALPEPEAGEGIDRLRGLVNVETDNDFVLLVSWLVAVLHGRPSFPVLTFTAEAGAGKSTVSKMLRALTDPNTAPIRAAPAADRDLFVQAGNAYVLAFDNLSFVSPWLSDAFCRLSTGGGFSTRLLHSDREEAIFYATRPIVLNGIPDLASRGDLAQRALAVSLASISDEDRRAEAAVMVEFEAARPAIIGALLDAVSSVLRNLPGTSLDQMPRMADFALVATAAEAGLGWDAGTFTAAYAENRQQTMAAAFEADIVASSIASWIKSEHPTDGFEGTASELLAALEARTAESIRKRKSWPANASAMGAAVRRAKPLLKRQGFVVEQLRRGDGRIVCILPPQD